jgi:glycosyltransferase involved in cell wall biosynthesis
MHVLYFHQHFATPAGSSGTRSYEFARALIERGHRVTMVCGQLKSGGFALPWDARRKWFAGSIDGIDVIALPLSYSNHDSLSHRIWVFLKFGCRSLGIALRRDYDVLYATSTPLTSALPGVMIKVLGRRQPFLFEVRDLWPELPRALGVKNPLLLGGMGLLEWTAYHFADVCVGLAPGIVEGIRRRSPAGRRIELIPNACDLELFHPGLRDSRFQLPGITAGDFVAAFTGAHGLANGLDAVLDTARELKRRGRRDIKLVMIGDGGMKEGLQHRAREEGLENCIFLPPMRKTELVRVTANLGCGLQILADVPAFYHGTSPNKFFDYISAGIPVLTNYPGWIADLVVEHGCGVAVPPGDTCGFASALCQLADQPNVQITMGRNARRLAEVHFSRHTMSGKFLALVETAA